jgi:hypothetical protein
MRDWVGQIGRSGEYHMERHESGLFSYSELQGRIPRLCQLSTTSVGPLQQALIMYWHIRDIWNPVNLVALTVTELNDTLPPTVYLVRFSCGRWH